MRVAATARNDGRMVRLSTVPFDSQVTRTAGPFGRRTQPQNRLLDEGQKVRSPETGIVYRVERLLGQGGFGQVYLARPLRAADGAPTEVCIKISPHLDAWVREAYFGQLLNDHPRAIQVVDRFPLTDASGGPLYCLVLECAAHGDLSAFLSRSLKPWSETAARREIAGILEVLRKLHRGQLLHRDLTPMNVFVCEGNKLKLGDFGIVRQQSDARGITARTMNLMTAPSEIVDGMAPKWQARDDVYQVGQLIAMVVKGDARARIRTSDVRALDCSDHLKEIIYRCIGERRKRYDTAEELIEALRNPPAALKPGAIRSLKGLRVAFTGFLSRPRKEAVRAAERAGAVVQSAPSSRTNVIVRGRPNTLQAAGKDGGLKLMEIKRLRELGHRITIINEARFWKLTAERPT